MTAVDRESSGMKSCGRECYQCGCKARTAMTSIT